ncbi:hypothetical protein C8F04DRAFT_1298323 [Mycena alexandri]|uniref:Uncharacterized protein n=1 Tax=Mycena alexandri TaxID=1745969 RepID=A0AAD6WWK4_9AGAR|nr:hypothetical protein C8F04DRAFT_1298323 [Mycena alexandri]
MTISLLLLALPAGAQAEKQVPFSNIPTDIWAALRTCLSGRVFETKPFAELYQNEKARTHQAGEYTWGQWEGCQDTGEQCLLDFAVPTDEAATASPDTCDLGSIPKHFIDVRGPADVIAAYEFSKETGIPPGTSSEEYGSASALDDGVEKHTLTDCYSTISRGGVAAAARWRYGPITWKAYVALSSVESVCVLRLKIKCPV